MVKFNKGIPTLGIILLFLISSAVQAQKNNRYLIYLKDKANTPYTLDHPEAFLSPRAIERRKKQGIPFKTSDLPVDSSYIQRVSELGIKVWYASKWMNALVVETDDATLAKLEASDFVIPESTLLSDKKPRLREGSFGGEILLHSTSPNPESKPLEIEEKDYGPSFNQMKMIGADEMHRQGYRGQGMIIAVFDSGFRNADQVTYFKHIFEDNRLLGTYDFVENDPEVFDQGGHGFGVLSTIAAYEKGSIIGTAPEASFFLFRTEDASSEYRVEEANWLIAAEKADSAGVDVINSSLGYNTFDNYGMDYSYQDLDGKTAIITKAADWAASTGMLVVTSAGNEGGDPWRYISAPADADSVLTIGAVAPDGRYIYFSSKGPTVDGRIKPDVCAQGAGTVVGSPNNRLSTTNGTSFSSPLVAGLVASFWKAHPELSNMEVIEIIRASGDQAKKPDTLVGYGIVNFIRAHEIANKRKEKSKSGFQIYPNPLPENQPLQIFLSEEYSGQNIEVEIYNPSGKLLSRESIVEASSKYTLPKFHHLQAGTYIVKLKALGKTNSMKIVKL